ncbi:S-adenosylmethionine mitochondrial carrier protein isoform X2 [Rhinolophus ferrumequinum]|uniref:S-adenosylmethionine mitochondrial carrier protein isoform X2 n=1 Tax=Rhinolophus ferrumequinum TaxID=59479 RepID=UPI00140F97A1|nr:S-adenosylmethionine mitochondrial carrier protein isoform X2 [Rhinolophus ferrumequinum]
MDGPGFTASLVAGGVAGVSVDLILFPLDTIKTRLQSPQGFNKAGGFRGIYAGVPSAAIGSFPNAAAFFITYEYVKWFLHTDPSSYLMPVKHMLAASAGEVVACLIRVPSEVVKQRAQVSASSRTFQIFSNILYQEGIQGLYRGYKSTVLREAVEISPNLVAGNRNLWESSLRDCSSKSLSQFCCLPAKFLFPNSSYSFLVGPVSPVGVLKSPLVLEAASRGGFLAVSSLWSFCRWVCCCCHHASGCRENKNHVSKGWFQHCQWERPLCPARGLADAGAVRIICRCLPSNGSDQSGRFHLSWCL